MTTHDTNYAATAMTDNELDTVVGGNPAIVVPLVGAAIVGIATFWGIAFSRKR